MARQPPCPPSRFSRTGLCVLLAAFALAAAGCTSQQATFYNPEPPVTFDAEAFEAIFWNVLYAFGKMASEG